MRPPAFACAKPETVNEALWPPWQYDERGQTLNAGLPDYLRPTIVDSPMIEIHRFETPSPVNPLWIKRTTEGGAIARHAAVANAVAGAIAQLNAEVREMPRQPATIRGLIHAC